MIPILSAGNNQGQDEGKSMQWILFGDHKRVILRRRCAAKSLLLQIHKTTATKRHVMFGFQVKFVWSISSVKYFISTVRATDKKEL